MTRTRPAHLPERLTITLWDFSWYVRTGPGEPFEDLNAAFQQAKDRGYNTIRICAMPFLLFASGLDTSAVTLGPLGGRYGQRVRWYDVKHTTTIDAQEHLLQLFRLAQAHDCFVILSSWEYQQSASFATDPSWWQRLAAVEPERRAEVLAEAHADLIDLLVSAGLDDRIAFTELHNEVQVGHLADGLNPNRNIATLELQPRLERGIDAFHRRHPDRLCTVNYAGVPVAAMRAIPAGVDVLAVHPYVYGVLDALIATFGLRGPVADFPQATRAELLLPDAPAAAEWVLAEEDRWKLEATIISPAEMYVHDWASAEAFDRWLYDHYRDHRLAMEQKLRIWLDVAADWANEHEIPLVLGEGWIGYTPLEGTFEEGPVGAQFCRLAMAESSRVGAWGSIVCSNAAPQHPMWADVALQRECNAIFTSAAGVAPSRTSVAPTFAGINDGTELPKHRQHHQLAN